MTLLWWFESHQRKLYPLTIIIRHGPLCQRNMVSIAQCQKQLVAIQIAVHRVTLVAYEKKLSAWKTSRKSLNTQNAHSRPGPEEIELKKLNLAGLFPRLLTSWCLDTQPSLIISYLLSFPSVNCSQVAMFWLLRLPVLSSEI